MRAAVVSILLLGGCSFLMSGPPAAPPAPPQCNPSRFPPIADIGIAFFGLIGTEISAGVGSFGDRSDTGLAIFVPVMAVAAVSSVYGFVRTGQCNQAYAARAAAASYPPPPGMAPAPGVPGPYPPPPPFAPPPP